MLSALRGVVILSSLFGVKACTNYLLTKSATSEGHNIISYSADSHTLYGALYHYPRANHEPGSMRKIVDWDGGFALGEIPEAEQTFNVVGNSNEHGLVIGETTFGGLPELSSQPGALIDYGSLIYIALQRSKTAREAISVMTQLVAQYGYASEGESFSLADPEEVWIMELIGKGPGERGAVWVARRVPEGYVCSHANQARITTFPQGGASGNDTMYAPDVISFARRKGLYPADKPDDEFDFAATYHPVTFEGARAGDARVWDFFRRVAPSVVGGDLYMDYLSGRNLSHRLPLWIKPDKPVALTDVMAHMRGHFENSPLDFSQDVGAQAFNMPYRWRPLTWTSNDVTYFNERSVGTQQTGWWFVAQLRAQMPAPLRALLLFGVDDTASSVLTPFYGGQTRTPECYAPGDMMEFNFDAAFWAFNLVANFAYTRYSLIHPEVQARQQELEAEHLRLVTELDSSAMDMFKRGQGEEAVEMVTQACVDNAERLVMTWLAFFRYLFTRFMDGNIKTPSSDASKPMPQVQFPGYPQSYLDLVAKETGDRYKEPTGEVRFVKVKGI